jgi:hypothetical protein
MEAARVLAERGHRVTLFEAAARLGGQILVAAQAPGRRDLLGVTDWRQAELDRLGVEVRLNIWAEAHDILAESPEIVIVATGGLPDLDWLDGAEHCHSTWDLLTGEVPPQGEILVYDGTGRQAAASCALKLAAGRTVTFATPDAVPAVEMPYQDASSFRKRFYGAGIITLTDHALIRVERQGNGLRATLRNEMTGAERSLDTAQVVVEHGTLPLDELFTELRTPPADGFVLHRIGDAVASRDLHASVLDAYRLCLTL